MTFAAVLLLIPFLLLMLYRYLRTRGSSARLWRAALTIGCLLGLTRALLASAGMYVLEREGGPVQIPAYAVAMLAWPEGALLGRWRATDGFYVRLSALLLGSTVLLVVGVAFVADRVGRSDWE